jgi:hypothetical protein
VKHIVVIATLVLAAPSVLAQPVAQQALPPESIIVTTVRPSDETIKNFVQKRAAPTRFLGKMARWKRKICPLTVGLGKTYAKYVTQRIRDIASAVGAPVNADPACIPNIQVVFTTTPQGFLDNVRKSGPVFLGYYNNSSQADELAKVSHPIQAWYTTESIDYDGAGQVDRGTCNGNASINTLPIQLDGDLQTPQGVITLNLPCAVVMHASGWRLDSGGHESGFYNAVIVAEPAKLLDYEVGSLADYIAMMALTQSASLDSCQDLPSISNLLAKGCSAVALKITDGDLAYLRALYNMPNGRGLSTQMSELRFQMKKTLVTDKGGPN